MRSFLVSTLFALTAVVTPVQALPLPAAPAPEIISNQPSIRLRAAGAVYVLTNEVSGNNIVAYNRTATGGLTLLDTYSTGGLGIGDGSDTEGLGSQGAIQLGVNHKYLYVANAGSNDISVFSVAPSGRLKLVQHVSSGGVKPISLTLHGQFLYALNYDREAADCGSIVGFTITAQGTLLPLANSSRSLSGCGVNPGDISFNADGTLLAVTEKATNLITTYLVGNNGLLGSTPVTSATAADSFPFSLAFTSSGLLLTTDDFNDVSKAGGVSSFLPQTNGSFSLISGPVQTQNTATCWVVITGNDKYAYVTNTNSGNISGLRIDKSGTLTLLNSDGVTASLGAGTKPRDMAFSKNDEYLYVLNSLTGTVSGFLVKKDGSLKHISQVEGLPAPGLNGLTAY